MSNNPVVHFEMPYEDGIRVSEFYNKAFGWKMSSMPQQMGDYVTAETSKTENGRPTEPGNINGGFFPKRDDMPAQFPSVVIAVEDIDKAMEDIISAGGKVLGKPVKIPTIGYYVSFLDSEGNRVSLLKPAA